MKRRSLESALRSTAIVAGLLLASGPGCEGSDEASDLEAAAHLETARSSLARTTTPSTTNVATLGANNRAFAFDMFHAIAATPSNAGQNLLFSPFSVSTALAMTYDGARGQTESELKKTLHFDLDKPLLHEAFNATDLALSSRGEGQAGADGTPFRLRVDNSLWTLPGASYAQPFLDTLAVHYGAALYLTDFAKDPEASRKEINLWVEERTERLIPELLPKDSIERGTAFVLTNTVYFNASWQTKFNPDLTRDATFTRADGSQVSAPMMQAELSIPYAAGDGYRAIALPYASDELRFVAILPDEGKSPAIEASLSEAWFSALEASWQTKRVQVGLPKLDYKAHASLKDQLRTLGMPSAFENADFSGITGDRSLKLSDVIHEAVLKVSEGGTIAAAATAVIATKHDAIEAAPTVCRLDRPFLFAILDAPTQAVLFLGRIQDPTAR